MKFHWFHLMPYPHLPDDFKEKYKSVWVDPPAGELYDPVKGHQFAAAIRGANKSTIADAAHMAPMRNLKRRSGFSTLSSRASAYLKRHCGFFRSEGLQFSAHSRASGNPES
jgi:hypothetical protein